MKFLKGVARGFNSLPFSGNSAPVTGNGFGALGIGRGNRMPGTDFDYKREAGELWKNGVVLAYIKFACRVYPSARQVVLRPASDGKFEQIDDHPILDLLAYGNADYDGSVVEAGRLLSLMVEGNAYLYKERSGAGKVVGLRYIPHFMITPYWPKDGSEFISGYLYRVNGKIFHIPKDDIIHNRDGIDPENERFGLSGLSAVLREVFTDNEAATYAAAILYNMGVPSIIVTPKNPGVAELTSVQLRALKNKFLMKFRGDERGQPWFHNEPIEVTTPGFSPEQMVLDKVRSIPVSRIGAALGFDPMVIGLSSEQKTYSNLGEALEAAYELNIVPMQVIQDAQTTRALMPDILGAKPKDKLGRDYSNVRVLQEDQNELFKRVADAYQKGVLKRMDARRLLNEEFDETGDDVYFTDLLQKQLDETETVTDDDQKDASSAKLSPQLIRRWIGKNWQRQRRKRFDS